MATRFSSALFPDNSVVANIRAWAGFIEDTLVTTGGWVVTSDTGQTAPASLSTPGGANTKAGYRIYRMNDSLQSTNPVYMRIDFGSGSSAGIPGFWFTIGTGSNGSGTITSILYNGGASSTPNVSCSSASTSQVNNSYGSATSSRVSLALFIQTTSQGYPLVLTIERTKDENGADTGTGLFIVNKGAATTTVAISRYLHLAGGTQPTVEPGLSYILTGINPSETFGGDIGVGIVIHFRGVAQQPGTNFMIVNSSDVSAEGTVSLTLYGATRTYQQLSSLVPTKSLAGSSTADNSARCMIRYD